MREVAIFGAAGLRSGATWIVASFLPGSSDAERNLETVRDVERDVQSKYDMICNSQGGVSPKYHSFVEFAFDERNLGDLGLRL